MPMIPSSTVMTLSVALTLLSFGSDCLDAQKEDLSSVLTDRVHAEGYGTFSLGAYIDALAEMRRRCEDLLREMEWKERELYALGINERVPWEIQVLLKHQGSLQRTAEVARDLAKRLDGNLHYLTVEMPMDTQVERCRTDEEWFALDHSVPCISGPKKRVSVSPNESPELRLAYAMSVLAGLCPGASARIELHGYPPSRVRRMEDTIARMDAAVELLRSMNDPRVLFVHPRYERSSLFVCFTCLGVREGFRLNTLLQDPMSSKDWALPNIAPSP